ncbi:Putative oxidoreductase Fe-S subunit [Escherichia coli]|nr:hypothetical protein VET9_19810 [Escherichia coli]
MNPVDRPLLDIGLTRLEFLRISGKGLAGLTIAPALLSLLGCKQEDIDSGTVGLINTPKGCAGDPASAMHGLPPL